MQAWEDGSPECMRRLIARLRDENARLKRLLLQHRIDYEEAEGDGTHGMLMPEITAAHARVFYSYFKGRKDVYARRNVTREGKGVYYPVCDNFWVQGKCPRREGAKKRCLECSYRQWTPLNQRVLMRHLQGMAEDGRDVVGVYPLLEDEHCHFIVFDFDNHEGEATIDWRSEVDTLRRLCAELGVDALVERSRSGNGAHVWLFFESAIPAVEARRFGACLLTRGAELVNQKSFHAYDRMLPAQDSMPEGGLGNLIALPLQGRALLAGNSAFVDEQWVPYSNQWARLQQTARISLEFVRSRIQEWGRAGELGVISQVESIDAPQPWKKQEFVLHREDVDGHMVVVDSCMLYVRKDNLRPRLCNALRRLASFRNPLFYRNRAMGLSVKGVVRIVPCFEEDDVYIGLPRGKREQVLDLCREGDISVAYEDLRNAGRPIKVEFAAQLYPEQQKAADAMLQNDIGILQAATAFGKTAVGAYLIAARKVNTLVLVHNREILKNWVDDLQRFLRIEDPLPEYRTPSGRARQRKSHIGRLFAAHYSVGGLVDVAMVTSLGNADDINPLVREYGMVIMDECHHGAAYQAHCVLNRVNAKYVYGLTATPKRDDGMEQKVLMAFGPVRYRFTARQRAESQNVRHLIHPRFTRFCVPGQEARIQELYRLLIDDSVRNQLIISDVMSAVNEGRTPLVLTKFRAHAEHLLEALRGKVKNLYLLRGGRSSKEREHIRRNLLATPPTESVVVVAIGQYIGEGFNYPRLDTLMLTTPIAWEGNVEQYAGRLHRDYVGKQDVIIYDYVDLRVRVFDRMYAKRLRTYRRMGYQLFTPMPLFEHAAERGAFFEAGDFEIALEKDILAAASEVVVSSTTLNRKGVKWFLELVDEMSVRAPRISVLTQSPSVLPEREEEVRRLISLLSAAGVDVQTYAEHHEHFVIIDRRIVWYGNANFLSMRKESDNVLRLENAETAADILSLVAEKAGKGVVPGLTSPAGI
ncbi:MAG: DEAD/DEAH box helicase family protein [Akkermansia sp.]|nr:DEAD/DEAH box helicase family protein [Akkermansia sp.]